MLLINDGCGHVEKFVLFVICDASVQYSSAGFHTLMAEECSSLLVLLIFDASDGLIH
jgi:hypothetical protein